LIAPDSPSYDETPVVPNKSHAGSASAALNGGPVEEGIAASTQFTAGEGDCSTMATQDADAVETAAGNRAPGQSEPGDNDDEDDDVNDSPPSRLPSARQEAARQRHNEFDELFAQWRATGDNNLRDRLILSNRNLVSYLARRYIDRGELSEDVMQVGLIGLIYALDHFDPSRGVRFATFATPTILGEIRRFFRDKTWGIRVPRRLQEVNQTINARIEELTQEMDRSPTYAEIARALNMPVEDVVEALEMMHIMEPVSIDEAMFNSGDDSAVNISDQIGAPDPDLETWGEWTTLETALEKLPENERRVLRLAYFDQHSQVEIARQLQVSQMFVSRLQRKALAHLRDLMNSVDV